MNSNQQNFFNDVYEVVRQIPEGRVTSYGAIASFLGAKSGARTVGFAMNASHVAGDIPAHRVVNRKGMLTGKNHFGHPLEMQKLLEQEGIRVKNDCVVDFEDHFWDPSVHLTL
ncbi:MGMT family protein [Lunatimonas salinarum]|uniref:MGMT family protein n=1 Tax=Lunatimonas salinarum TaxID=1774590 RepID=UPI001ADFB48F